MSEMIIFMSVSAVTAHISNDRKLRKYLSISHKKMANIDLCKILEIFMVLNLVYLVLAYVMVDDFLALKLKRIFFKLGNCPVLRQGRVSKTSMFGFRVEPAIASSTDNCCSPMD